MSKEHTRQVAAQLSARTWRMLSPGGVVGKEGVLPTTLVKVRGMLAENRKNTLKIPAQDTNNLPPKNVLQRQMTPQNGVWLNCNPRLDSLHAVFKGDKNLRTQ